MKNTVYTKKTLVEATNLQGFKIALTQKNHCQSRNFAKKLKLLFLALFSVIGFASKAQTCNPANLELAGVAGTYPTGNGPTVADQTFTFSNNVNNPTDNVMSAYAPATTVTFSLSNQQFTNMAGLAVPKTGMTFGRTFNAASAITRGQSAVNSAAGTNYTSSNYATGVGITGTNTVTATTNVGAWLMINDGNGLAGTNQRPYYGDLTLTFSSLVDNPILHFNDFGGITAGKQFVSEYEMTNGYTMTKLSGGANVVIAGNTITNTPQSLENASVRINGNGITSITFKVYLESNSTTNWGTGTGGEAIVIGVSVPSNTPLAPIPVTATPTYSCPNTTANITGKQPAAVSGTTLEWHNVASNPTAASLQTPTAVGAGTYYLYAKDILTGCYSPASTPVIVAAGNLDCADCDADGVANEFDLDDDNDGVPDKTEMNCGLTQTWSGSAGVYEANITPDLKVRVTFTGTTWSGITPIANFARNCLDPTYLSDYEPLSNTGKPGLQFNVNGGSVGATFKVEYLNAANQPVTVNNPRMHLGGLGGSYGTGFIGSSDWTLTGGKTQTLLANDAVDFGATSTTIFHPRLFGPGSGVGDCATGEGSGTLQINGPQSSYSYSVDMNGNTFDQMIVLFEGCSEMDTDNDGKPNTCDLDSDGDGCSDAYEAGATNDKTANYTFTSPYGANGLANSLENNDTQTATVSYTSTYNTYALDGTPTGNKCNLPDCDNDGVPDVIDIDDDNDGVLDITECDTYTVFLREPVFAGYSPNVPVVVNGANGNINYTWNQTITPNDITYNSLGWTRVATNVIPNAGQIKISIDLTASVTGTYVGLDAALILNNKTGVYTLIDNINPPSGGFSTTGTWLYNTGIPSNFVNATQTRADAPLAGKSASYTFSGLATCTASCNLDSDGDGCSDAYEAGATNDKTANYTFPGPYGSNGLANSLENNDTQTATTSYTSTYSTYAVDASADGNLCALPDCDNDGVANINDIDDDNDGVLDIVECPAARPYKVYTYSITNATFSSNIPVSIVGQKTLNTTFSQATAGTDLTFYSKNWKLIASDVVSDANQKITITMTPNASTNNTNVIADAILITDGINTYIIDNSAASPDFTKTGTWQSSTNAASYSVGHNFLQTPFTGGQTATWTFSNIPNPTSACDKDADGILNSCDLDSDGDGCSDAVEAGATPDKTANFTFAGPYGANGLANSLEDNDTQTATVNFTSIYNIYALDNTQNYCTLPDCDNDGIPNVTDIDDDNDGVLDTVESPCVVLTYTGADQVITAPANAKGMIVKAWGAGGGHENVDGATRYGGVGGFTTATFGSTVVTPGTQFTVVVGSGGNRNNVRPTETAPVAVYGFGSVSGHEQGGGLSGIFTGSAAVTETQQSRALVVAGAGSGYENSGALNGVIYPGSEAYNGNSPTSGGVTASMRGSTDVITGTGCTPAPTVAHMSGGGGGYQGGGRIATVNATYSGNYFTCGNTIASARGGSGFVSPLATQSQLAFTPDLTANTPPMTSDYSYIAGVGVGGSLTNTAGGNGLVVICWIIDTDNDGTPNTCDTDSDGDGCSDAFEAGATTNKSANYTFAAPYGTNGLANNLENNDTQAATVNYINTYNTYALDGTVNGNKCSIDWDEDGTPNNIDIDDDNDGILDTVENQGAIAYTGKDQTFTVPCNVTQLNVKLWGAGGGGSSWINNSGGGGFASATIPVTPGETLTLIVGEGGKTRSSAPTYGGGGGGGTDAVDPAILLGASGGGRTEIRRGTTTLVVAGGGGGAGYATWQPTAGTSNGGAGGGAVGLAATANSQVTDGNGKGGTQTAGGAGGVAAASVGVSYNGSSGVQYQGGNGGKTGATNAGGGGGGGGGWYGGGGGSGFGNEPSQESAGGGGSGYTAPSVTNPVLIAGTSGSTTGIGLAGNNTDPNYIAGVGVGAAVNQNGGNGLIFIAELLDFDNDGIPNSCDLDSDGDSCPDAVEAGLKTTKSDSVFVGPVGANGLVNSIETNDTQTATVTNSPFYSATNYVTNALSCTINVCNDDCDSDGVANLFDIDDDNDGVLDNIECPSYKVYTYNRVGTFSTNAPFTITGTISQNVIVNQSTAGTDLTSNGVNWKLMASDVLPDASNKITVSLLPTVTTNASFLVADAMLITNGVNTYIVDNSATSGFVTSGTWINQNFGANYLASETYSNAPHTGKTATWTFSNLPALATYCDTDGDGKPNTCDLDSDGDGCSDAFEAGATTDKTANYTFSGNVGANGLANSIENNDTQTAGVNFTPTYSFATNALYNACNAPQCTSEKLTAAQMSTIPAGSASYTYPSFGNTNTLTISRTAGTQTMGNIPSGTLQGIHLGAGIPNNKFEDYSMEYSSCVASMSLSFRAINNNVDGREEIQDFKVFDCNGADITSSVSFAYTDKSVAPHPTGGTAPYTIFDQTTRTIKGTQGTNCATLTPGADTGAGGTCCDDGGMLTIVSSIPFKKITYRREGRQSVLPSCSGLSNSNGVTLSDSITWCTVCVKPLAGNDTTVCAGTAMNLTGKSPTTGTWTAQTGNPTGATLGTTTGGIANVAFNTTASGNYNFIYTAAACSDTVKITVTPLPTTPTNPSASPANICAGQSSTLSATCASGTVTWYSDAALNTVVTSPVSPTATTTYYVACVNGICKSPSASVVVTVTPIPTTPTNPTASPASVCVGQSSTLSATCASGTVTWYSDAALNTVVTSPVSPTATTTYYVACVNGTCKSPSANVVVTVTPVPTAPTNPTASPSTICAGQSSTLSATCASGTVTWYSDAALTTVVTSPVSPTATTTYYVACVSGTCKSPSANVVVTVTPVPTAPTNPTASPSTICAGQSSTLSATCASGTVTWYSDAALTTVVTSPVSPTITTTYYVACVNGTCKSPSANVVVTVTPVPTAPTITPITETICLGSSSVLTATGCAGIVNWYVQGSTTSLGTGTSYSASPSTTTIYEATCTIGTCTSSKSTSTITVVAPPSNPSISVNDANICVGTSITLTAINCTGTLLWFKDGSTTSFATGLSTTDTPTSNATYTATCNGNGAVICASGVSTPISVTVNAIPAIPTISPSNTTICSGTSIDLVASGCVSPEIVLWSSGQTGSTITVSPAINTTYTAKCVNNTTGCESPSSAGTTITVGPTPTNPPTNVAASPSTICIPQSSTLTATCSVGTVTWYSDVALTTVISSTVNPIITTTYYVACVNGSCKSPSSNVTVTVNTGVAPLLTTVSPVCNGSTYSVTFASNGTVTASAGTVSGNTVTGIPVGTNVVLTATSTNGCATSAETITSPTSCTNPPSGCVTPTLSAGQGVCTGTGTYSVAFQASTGATITTSAGTVSGNTITGIPIAANVTITATDGACNTSITVTKPIDCTTPCASPGASFAVAACSGSTYSVSISNPNNATITASTGTVSATAITGIAIGTSVTITTTAAGCTPQTITLNSPDCEEPSIAIVKGSSLNLGTDNVANAGDIITYSYDVTNNGNVPLTGVTVTESTSAFTGTGILPSPTFVSATLSSPEGNLKVGEKATYTATYAITAADIAAGKVDNSAFANGLSPKNVAVKDTSDSKNPADYNETGTPSDPNGEDKTGTPIAENPKIAIVKGSALNLGTDGIATVGDIITYSYDVTNTGNVPLTGVSVVESATSFSGTGTLPSPTFVSATAGSSATNLLVAGKATFTATYAITAADIAAGKVDNSAFANGLSPKNVLLKIHQIVKTLLTTTKLALRLTAAEKTKRVHQLLKIRKSLLLKGLL